MVRQLKKPSFDHQIEIVSKTPYQGSGPRGVDVYTRLLIQALSRLIPLKNIHLGRDVVSNTKLDLVHYTFFDPFFLTLWRKTPKKTPYIVTVHDMIPLVFPSHFPPGLRGKLKWFLQKRALCQASAIITDSQASKKDIISFTKFAPDKIHVIPLAAGHTVATASLCRSVKTEYHLPDRYILYVGDINWNKNIPNLIEAFAKQNSSKTHLVLVGKAFSSSPTINESIEIEQTITKYNIGNRVHKLGFIPGHHLSAIYRLATLYVQPSWYEGFGFPVIEALTQGTPVLSSNQGSLPEVGGGVVHYFDPNKSSDLTNQLGNLLSNKLERDKYKQAGLIWVKQFSWKIVALSTLKVYEKYLV